MAIVDSFKELEGDPQLDRFGRAAAEQGRSEERHAALRRRANTPAGRAVERAGNASGSSSTRDIGKILSNKAVVLDPASAPTCCRKQMPLLNSSMEQVVNILQQRNGSSEQMLGTPARCFRRPHHPSRAGDPAGWRRRPVGGRWPVPRRAAVRQRAQGPDRGQSRQRRQPIERRQCAQDPHRHGCQLGRAGRPGGQAGGGLAATLPT